MMWEGRFAQAEKFVRGAVRTLEKGGEQSLLAEALTTLGIVLARTRDYQQAHSVLKRAIAIVEQAGDLEGAGNANLTLLEEVAPFCPMMSYARLWNMPESCFGILRISRCIDDWRNAHARRFC
ncbi:MAG: tetratricopeptide repeat protein [Pyrinomonadaceae bacterium]